MNTPISQHILEVQNYIVYSEMGGFIDETDPWHSTLMLLEELKEKVLDEEEILDNTNKNWENTIMNKTKEQIEWQVNMWDGNMNIFEIYDEIRDGHTGEEQEALLNHAYDTWHYNDLIAELASHFGVKLHNYEPKLKEVSL